MGQSHHWSKGCALEKNLMKLEIAKPEDAEALHKFYKQFLVRGSIEVKIDRNQDFFAPYDIQSDKHITYLLKSDLGRANQPDKIEGMASFVIQDVLIDNEVTTVAFGRDLRISSSRQAALEWTRHFLPVMDEVLKTFGCKYFFAVLSVNGQAKAQNAFFRPRNLKRPLPNNYPYRRFNMVSVHGRLPWAKNPLPNLKIKHGHASNKDALIEYVCKKSRGKNLATVWDAESFYEKIKHWKGLKIEDFLIAFDKNENIVGCMAPWSSGGIQDFIPMHYSMPANNFRQFLKFGKMFGWTRTLTKPFSRLQIEASLNFKYLCFLNSENSDVFESLLWRAYDEAEENEFLVYNQVRSEYIYRSPYNWIAAKQPFGVYLLQPPNIEAPAFLHPSNEKSIEIEPFFNI